MANKTLITPTSTWTTSDRNKTLFNQRESKRAAGTFRPRRKGCGDHARTARRYARGARACGRVERGPKKPLRALRH
eukprot:11197570-Lingulodinium_polyedra.AAC.1